MSSAHFPRPLILACAATKRSNPGYMPAIERYNGPLWQTLRAVDPDATASVMPQIELIVGCSLLASVKHLADA